MTSEYLYMKIRLLMGQDCFINYTRALDLKGPGEDPQAQMEALRASWHTHIRAPLCPEDDQEHQISELLARLCKQDVIILCFEPGFINGQSQGRSFLAFLAKNKYKDTLLENTDYSDGFKIVFSDYGTEATIMAEELAINKYFSSPKRQAMAVVEDHPYINYISVRYPLFELSGLPNDLRAYIYNEYIYVQIANPNYGPNWNNLLLSVISSIE